MPDNARIEQFKKMAHDDPNNELGHYSLAQEYLKMAMYDEAIASYERVLQIRADMSRAYHGLARALLGKGLRDKAIETLSRGVVVAHERGDMMPRNEMTRMLKDLGAPVPEVQVAAVHQPVGEGQVRCARCHQIGKRLPAPPFRTAQGQEIYERICAACWREWIAMGTKVINELRLPLNDPQAQKIFDDHMYEFLNLR